MSEFYPAKHTVNKIDGRCKPCEIGRRQRWASGSIENTLSHLCQSHKVAAFGRSGSRRRSLAETSCVTTQLLMQLWVKQAGKCAVTGVPMTHILGQGRNVFTNVSIDRIDSEFGYIPDNVRLVCKAVNYMKNSMTDREMIQWAALILNGPVAHKP